MTIEEMINLLEEVKELDEFFQYNPKYLEDFNIMIETLKQLSCDDVISRQTVLEYIKGSEAELGHDSENELVCQDIKEMPPAIS